MISRQQCVDAQARSETLEAMLLLTTTELRQMQSKQEPLEKKIQMLETLIAANSVSSSAGLPTSLQQVCMALRG